MSGARVDAATHAAVDWLLRLESAADQAGVCEAFQRWLNESPAHQQAWQRVSSLLQQPIADLREVEARSPGQLHAASQALALPDSPQRRRVLAGGALMRLLGVSGAGLADRVAPLDGWLADWRTATGERATFVLADGSRVTLDARSSVDIHFDPARRLLRLREGVVFVDVARDAGRPFVVATAVGEVQALGTQFQVRQEAGGSLVSVQQHSVQLTTRGGQRTRLEEGHAAWFDAAQIQPLALSLRSRTDWREGRIDVRDEPLGSLVDALRPYRPGLLRISPQAARMRVYGVFPLDDSEHTLAALEQTLPISVTRYGPLLTVIDVR